MSSSRAKGQSSSCSTAFRILATRGVISFRPSQRRASEPSLRTSAATEGPGGRRIPAKYTMLHLVGDVIALLDALGEARAVVVGHDLGALVAWNCALLRPDRVRGVAGLSTAFHRRIAIPPTQAIKGLVGDGYMYMLHFQEPGVAERDFAVMGIRSSLRRGLYGSSGDAPRDQRWRPVGPAGMAFFEGTVDPERPLRGSPRTTSMSMPANSSGRGSRALSTGIAPWTRPGSTWRPLRVRA